MNSDDSLRNLLVFHRLQLIAHYGMVKLWYEHSLWHVRIQEGDRLSFVAYEDAFALFSDWHAKLTYEEIC